LQKKPGTVTQEAAQELAIQALSFIAADQERLGRFLAISGIGPAEIRAAAAEPGFLAGVLEYLAGDEGLLTAFAADRTIDPAVIARAHAALGGNPWERAVP
jgi:hypothetical protein